MTEHEQTEIERLYWAYHKWVLHIIWADYVGDFGKNPTEDPKDNNWDLAAEISGKVWLNVARGWPNCRTKDKPKSWLRTIIRNTVTDARRGNALVYGKPSLRLPVGEDGDYLLLRFAPTDQVAEQGIQSDHDEQPGQYIVAQGNYQLLLTQSHREDQKELLDRALLRLEPRAREIVCLHALEGLKQHKVAQKLGIDRSRVSQLFHAALDTLRAYLWPHKQFLLSDPTARELGAIHDPEWRDPQEHEEAA